MDLSTGSSKVSVVIEGLPQGKQRFLAWLGSRINQNHHLWVENSAKAIKEPTMGIDLFAVFLFQAEDHLDRGEVGGLIALGPNQLLIGGHG